MRLEARAQPVGEDGEHRKETKSEWDFSQRIVEKYQCRALYKYTEEIFRQMG